MMDLIRLLGTDAAQQLLANHKEQEPLKGTRRERDFMPVCKLFLPWTSVSVVSRPSCGSAGSRDACRL